jgi:hypothetical protein
MMRLKVVLAGVAAALVQAIGASMPAQAFDWDRSTPSQPDPYAWRHVQPGYYPYYGSRYWVPAEQMRYRYRYTYEGPRYRYYPAWGYSDRKHAETAGYHRWWWHW